MVSVLQILRLKFSNEINHLLLCMGLFSPFLVAWWALMTTRPLLDVRDFFECGAPAVRSCHCDAGVEIAEEFSTTPVEDYTKELLTAISHPLLSVH